MTFADLRSLIGWTATVLIMTLFAVILSGCGHSPQTMPMRPCESPSAPNGTTVTVDAQGNASSPYKGGWGLECINGTWYPYSGG